jgi:hypothetical protein
MSGDPSKAGEPRDLQSSHHDASGAMGVSSEREGHAGPGQQGTDGVRDTSTVEDDGADTPPEQSAGGVEENPEGLTPKAGYSKTDPRSD